MNLCIKNIHFALTTLLILATTEICSQNHTLKGQLLDKDSRTGIIAAHIELYKDTVLINSTMTDQSGFFILDNIVPGEFNLHVLQIGQRTLKLTQVSLPADTLLIITYPALCTYNSRKPNTCIGDHTDKIIPIVYGLPTKRILEKAKKGKIHLGGCIVSNCDPNFYCTIHNKEL